jgi:hypothetical protein
MLDAIPFHFSHVKRGFASDLLDGASRSPHPKETLCAKPALNQQWAILIERANLHIPAILY